MNHLDRNEALSSLLNNRGYAILLQELEQDLAALEAKMLPNGTSEYTDMCDLYDWKSRKRHLLKLKELPQKAAEAIAAAYAADPMLATKRSIGQE